jgi:hypothetical protein
VISTRYSLAKLPLGELLQPVSLAGTAIARLDERISRSPVGPGWIERSHFTDACAALWIDGELVHLEDLVLHDAGHDIRAPTHELTIARDILRSRRRIAAQAPGWALGAEGLRSLRGQGRRLSADEASAPEIKGGADAAPAMDDADAGSRRFDAELAAIDAVLARTAAAISDAGAPVRRMGPRTSGSTRGGPYFRTPAICRRCCGPLSRWTPGTAWTCFSTPPGSAGSWARPFCATPA